MPPIEAAAGMVNLHATNRAARRRWARVKHAPIPRGILVPFVSPYGRGEAKPR